MILVTNFQNRQALGALRRQHRFTLNFGDLKLHDLAKLCFFFQINCDEIEL